MPGVQVLPAVPSFGEKLAETLAQAGTNIGQGFLQRQQNVRDMAIVQNPNMSPMQKLMAISPQRAALYATAIAPTLKEEAQESQISS